MTTMQDANFVSNWKEIVSGFLKLGATAYGGPAIMGLLALWPFWHSRLGWASCSFIRGG